MSVKSKTRLSTLSYVILYVKDTARALEFYRDKLGMEVKLEDGGWIELETGSATLALHATDETIMEKHSTTPIVVFNVDNIKESYEELKKQGVKFDKEPHEVCSTPEFTGLSADFEDLDGNRLSIYGMIPKK
ncbi:MAG: VOC family protein [Cyanobacteria bacterium HKST-UBA02]|nr:VOC family protein [Cyanobacteria bacterium HKST-UBA02]